MKIKKCGLYAILAFSRPSEFVTATKTSENCPAGADEGFSCSNRDDPVADTATDSRSHDNEDFAGCDMWLAESSIANAGLGVYSGTSVQAGQRVGEPDIVIPIIDPDKRTWSPIHEFTWNGDLLNDLFMENSFITDSLAPGLGAFINCHMGLNNLDLGTSSTDNAGLHRSRDASVGSFSHRYNYSKIASRDIVPGEELFVNYGEHWFIDREAMFGMIPFKEEFENSDRIGSRILKDIDAIPADVWDFFVRTADSRLQLALPVKAESYKNIASQFGGSTARASCPNSIRSPQWLWENGHCVDRLYAAISTIREAGRGAFAKKSFRKGEVITVSPMIHFGFDQIPIKKQSRSNGETIFSKKSRGKQLLLNYAFSQDDSDIFLVPYGPIVNFINHNTYGPPNAFIRWSSSRYHKEGLLKLSAAKLVKEKHGLIIEYVALRDIDANEEIFIDYGESWVKAWDQHVQNFIPALDAKDYVSATEFNLLQPIRTVSEQEANPYPPNLQTACDYESRYHGDPSDSHHQVTEDDMGTIEVRTTWQFSNDGSRRPCTILSRSSTPNNEHYTAVMAPLDNDSMPETYFLGSNNDERHIVYHIPRSKVSIADKAYSTDIHSPNAFRHHINAPEDMFPDTWSRHYKDPDMVVVSEDLKPFQLEQMKLRESGESIADYAYTLGLPSTLTRMLLEYCNKMGITDRFNELLYTKSHEPGIGTYEDFGDLQWYVQRPDSWWNSNMHWISPANAGSHEDYLRLLGESGFEDILEIIGTAFDWDGLVCFHLTFLAVSECDDGFAHYDFHDTGGKGFNIIIPLILVNNSKPELDLYFENEQDKATYKYRYNVASLLGDNAIHSTSSIDYTPSSKFRMAATVYVADVNRDNVDNILLDYTQAYPPKDPILLLKEAGKHWQKGKAAKLPSGPRIFKDCN